MKTEREKGGRQQVVDRNSEWENDNLKNMSRELLRANPGHSWRDMWVHFGGGKA